MNKKVLIIVPVYNVGKYLKKCLDSVFSQSYSNIEVICVDDGSTDNSPEILNNYKKIYKNLTIIHKDNGGLSSARNAALKQIKSFDDYYIVFVDSDDWLAQEYISRLVSFAEKYKADIVSTSFIYASNSKEKIFISGLSNGLYSNLEATKFLLKDETIQSHVHTKIYKSELLKDQFFDEQIKYMEDQAFTFQLFYKSKGVYVNDYAGYYYRQDNDSSLTKKPMNNRKVISGLKAYYIPCNYPFKAEDRDVFINEAQNALVAAYLMLIPYYKRKDASKEDKLFIKEIKRYIKRNGLIKKYVPNSKENKIKKKMYSIFPHLYPLLFRIYKKVK